MALITCPECNGKISDRAEVCIHCGYPIKKINDMVCNINGVNYDLTDIYYRIIKHKKNNGKADIYDDIIFRQIFKDTFQRTHLDRAAYLCKTIYETEKVPESYSGETLEIPKCPTCGSTNIQKISGTERAMSVIGLGIMSKKIGKSFKCNHCKYTW